MAQGVPGRLRPRIFLTFGTTSVVGRQRNALSEAESIPGRMVLPVAPRKIPATDATEIGSRDRSTSNTVP